MACVRKENWKKASWEQDGKQWTMRLEKWTGPDFSGLCISLEFHSSLHYTLAFCNLIEHTKFVLKVLSFLYKLCQRLICFHWPPCFHSVEHLISFMLLVISHYAFMFIHEGQDSLVLRAIAGAVQPLHFLLLTCRSHPRLHPILVTDKTVVGIWLGLASSKSLKFFLCVWKIWLSLEFSFINNRETYSG